MQFAPCGGGCRCCSTSICRCANSLRIRSALFFPELTGELALDSCLLNLGTRMAGLAGWPVEVFAPAELSVGAHASRVQRARRAAVQRKVTRHVRTPSHCNLCLQDSLVPRGELVPCLPAVYIFAEEVEQRSASRRASTDRLPHMWGLCHLSPWASRSDLAEPTALLSSCFRKDRFIFLIWQKHVISCVHEKYHKLSSKSFVDDSSRQYTCDEARQQGCVATQHCSKAEHNCTVQQ